MISIYKKHRSTIDSYLQNLVNSYQKDPIENYKEILKHRYIQLIYAVNEDFKQTTMKIGKYYNCVYTIEFVVNWLYVLQAKWFLLVLMCEVFDVELHLG